MNRTSASSPRKPPRAMISATVGGAFSAGSVSHRSWAETADPQGISGSITGAASDLKKGWTAAGNPFFKGAYLVKVAASWFTVSINEFNEVGRLSKGELVEFNRMVSIFLSIMIVRGLPLVLLGMWLFRGRELGSVIRR